MSVRLDPTTIMTAASYSASVTHNTANGATHALVKDNTVKATMVGVNLLNAAIEIDSALTGDAGKKFKPSRVIVRVTEQTGPGATGDSHIQVGTSAGGTQICASTHMTDLKTVGQCFIINLANLFADIAGNATLYAKCATVDSTGTTMLATVEVEGVQI